MRRACTKLVSWESMSRIDRLRQIGVEPNVIANTIFNQKTPEMLISIQKALSRLSVHTTFRYAYTYLTDQDALVSDDLLALLRSLKDVDIIMMFRETPKGIKISLRSKTSLMQVAGRAARNINGKVIFYGDKITKSMKFVMDETNRRRKLQKEHNRKNNITPKTIQKSINEIRLSTAVADENNFSDNNKELIMPEITIENMEDQELLELFQKKMLLYARELQFEKAAIVRDKMTELEKKLGIKALNTNVRLKD